MRKKIIIAAVVVIPIVIYLGLKTNQSNSSEAYIEEITAKRQEQEDYLKTSSSSPFAKDKSSFKPLNYYPIDPKFRVKANVNKLTNLEYVNVGESDGSTKRYVKYATLSFEIDDMPMELLVLKPSGFGQMNILFTAFADETSSFETYGAGRYLDLDFKNASTITLDFNLAYNPYCAYNESFTCPLPPKENILPIKIEAGEKKFHKD